MKNISSRVKKIDHDSKISGRELYTADFMSDSNGRPFLSGRLVRSPVARGMLKNVSVPELPDGYFYISAKDAPRNIAFYPFNDVPSSIPEDQLHRMLYSTPLFADTRLEYAGQPIGMIVGPDEKTVRSLVSACRIECEEEKPVVRIEDAEDEFFHMERSYGNPKPAFLTADYIYDEVFTTGRQYQAYLEPQSIIAEPWGNRGVYIRGSLQCPFPLRRSVAYALDCSPEDIRVKQEATGGAFGGKEDFPSFLGTQAAVAAYATGRSVRIVLDRAEDLQFAYKRHPSRIRIQIAVRDGKITAMDVDTALDGGASMSSTGDVLARHVCTFPGVYSFDSLHVFGRAVKTNTPPTGAFRGFGVPQAIFAVEMAMSHLARELGRDEIEFKKEYMAVKGSRVPTGGSYPFDVPLRKMLDMADVSTLYFEKHEKYSNLNGGRIRHGIGIAFAEHGFPLCSNTEWKKIKAKVRLLKSADGKVRIITGQTDLGQGIRTILSKIAANELGIPMSDIICGYPDTALSYDTGPTAASRSTQVVGKTVLNAANRLRQVWIDGEEQEVCAEYGKPDHDTPFDDDTLTGVQYEDYSWQVSVVEVAVDTLTGNITIPLAHSVINVGTPIDEAILRGQMEGGLLQAIGYSASERIVFGDNGKIFNTGFPDYHMPTSTDVRNLSVEFQYDEYPEGPYGAKGAGELPLSGVSAAYLLAMEQALGRYRPLTLNSIPFVAEDALTASLTGGKKHG